MSGPCQVSLPPKVAALSIGLSGVLPAAPGAVQACNRAGPGVPDAMARRMADDQLVCTIMCCCMDQPAIGVQGQDLRQSCASQSLAIADLALGFRGRYKPEISYDMTGLDPRPFMHRDGKGLDTTEASRYWLGRARDEIENFARGRGQVRRPDLTIVRDPCLPPVAGNVERVVEMKFGADRRDDDQDRSYSRIAGGPENYSIFRVGGPLRKGEQGCDCADALRQLQPVPAPAPARQADKSRLQLAGEVAGFGILSVVATVGAAAAALVPVDGPFGELALGAGAAAAAARTATAWRALLGMGAAAGAAAP